MEAGKVWAGGASLPVNILKSFTNHFRELRGALSCLLQEEGQDQTIHIEDSCHLPDPSLPKGSSDFWTPGHQAVDLLTLRWWPTLPSNPPTPGPTARCLSQQGWLSKETTCL